MNNPYIGSDFDSFLQEEGILAEVEAGAVKKLLAIQLQAFMQAQHLSKTAMAERMQASRSVLDN